MRSIARRLAVSLVAASLVGAVASEAALASTVVVHRARTAAAPVRRAGWVSSNWSGYARTADAPYTSATARWVVPAVSRSKGPSYSSAWVGIDGFDNSELIQAGTESDYYGGTAHYLAWWEILPAPETRIAMTVQAGDVMAASITKGSRGRWTISIRNTTTGDSFTTTRTYAGPGSSVEWIVEAPSVGGRIARLAHYASPETFDPGTANGRNPRLSVDDAGAMIQKSRQVSTPSVPDRDTDGFNMAYGSTAPAPPSS